MFWNKIFVRNIPTEKIMTSIIKGIKNEKPFYYFEEISKIPRGSRNEAAITEYICDFAKSRGLAFIRDESNNVLITKKATLSRENEDAILLQAHTDMVCEKNKASSHDFINDPITLIQEGNILRADGTTLGADDGFGVATMLAILDSAEISHPRLECLFTSGEEIGLVGASQFDYRSITARKLINLDSAEENTVIIGCCGGVRTRFTCPMSEEKGSFSAYKIFINGLFGGHSGEDIDRKRLNANVLMGKLLKHISEKAEIRLVSMDGGDRDNAIPRECEATLVCSLPLCEMREELYSFLKSFIMASEDKSLSLTIEKTDTSAAFSVNDTKKLIEILSTPNGVLKYRELPPVLPKVSRNLARARVKGGAIEFGFSSRSYLEDELDSCKAELDRLAEKIGGSAYHHERYPGWESPRSSKLVTDYVRAYENVNGGQPEITLIHAGLECGIITGSVKDMEAISIGCNVHDLHTPYETMEIDSMDRIYDIILEFLKGKSL